jgi:hypothetical protein
VILDFDIYDLGIHHKPFLYHLQCSIWHFCSLTQFTLKLTSRQSWWQWSTELLRITSSGMLCHMALVRTGISEEHSLIVSTLMMEMIHSS